MTERLHFDFSLSCIGEGNGNPLQCSCLENPRDGGAWWAAVYGVTQTWRWAEGQPPIGELKVPLFTHFLSCPLQTVVLTLPLQRVCSSKGDVLLLLLLLLSRFSRVRLCATPQMAAHQAPPSLGFSRQEHWSGLPFPSPMHESEKSK